MFRDDGWRWGGLALHMRTLARGVRARGVAGVRVCRKGRLFRLCFPLARLCVRYPVTQRREGAKGRGKWWVLPDTQHCHPGLVPGQSVMEVSLVPAQGRDDWACFGLRHRSHRSPRSGRGSTGASANSSATASRHLPQVEPATAPENGPIRIPGNSMLATSQCSLRSA